MFLAHGDAGFQTHGRVKLPSWSKIPENTTRSHFAFCEECLRLSSCLFCGCKVSVDAVGFLALELGQEVFPVFQRVVELR